MVGGSKAAGAVCVCVTLRHEVCESDLQQHTESQQEQEQVQRMKEGRKHHARAK